MKLLKFCLSLVVLINILSTENVFSQITSPIITKLPRSGNGFGFALDDEKHFVLWPASNKKKAEVLWGDTSLSFLKTVAISGTQNGGAANIELLSTFFGTVRTSLITTIAAHNKDSLDINTAKERFFSSGGNMTLSFNQIGPMYRIANNGFIMTNLVPKLSADLPALGSSIENPSANLDLGLEARLNLPSNDQKFGLLGYARAGYAIGTEKFYSNLNVNQNPFFYFQYHIGFTIPTFKVAVLFSRSISSSTELKDYNQKFRLSVCITN